MMRIFISVVPVVQRVTAARAVRRTFAGNHDVRATVRRKS